MMPYLNLQPIILIMKVSAILFWHPFGSAPHLLVRNWISDLNDLYRPHRKHTLFGEKLYFQPYQPVLAPQKTQIQPASLSGSSKVVWYLKNGLLYQFGKYLNWKLSSWAQRQAQVVYKNTSQWRARKEMKLIVKVKMWLFCACVVS